MDLSEEFWYTLGRQKEGRTFAMERLTGSLCLYQSSTVIFETQSGIEQIGPPLCNCLLNVLRDYGIPSADRSQRKIENVIMLRELIRFDGYNPEAESDGAPYLQIILPDLDYLSKQWESAGYGLYKFSENGENDESKMIPRWFIAVDSFSALNKASEICMRNLLLLKGDLLLPSAKYRLELVNISGKEKVYTRLFE